jgi:C_GCAxxG_C_C family probable redox protein
MQQDGFGCSEAVVYAMSEHLWGAVDETLLKASTPLRGGFAGTKTQLCGALSGGGLIIGALYGRTAGDQDSTRVFELTERFQTRFTAKFGWTGCGDLRANGYGGSGIPCAELVEQAVLILLDILEPAEA